MFDSVVVEKIFHKYGVEDFRWISGNDVVVRRWVRMKCLYGCPFFGERPSCPPHAPSIDDCREFFSEYENVAILQMKCDFSSEKSEMVSAGKIGRVLLAIERDLLFDGFAKAFSLFPSRCRVCEQCDAKSGKCSGRSGCRPSTTAFGIELAETVEKVGWNFTFGGSDGNTSILYAVIAVN